MYVLYVCTCTNIRKWGQVLNSFERNGYCSRLRGTCAIADSGPCVFLVLAGCEEKELIGMYLR